MSISTCLMAGTADHDLAATLIIRAAPRTPERSGIFHPVLPAKWMLFCRQDSHRMRRYLMGIGELTGVFLLLAAICGCRPSRDPEDGVRACLLYTSDAA